MTNRGHNLTAEAFKPSDPLSPEDLGRLFANLPSDDQARFWNGVAAATRAAAEERARIEAEEKRKAEEARKSQEAEDRRKAAKKHREKVESEVCDTLAKIDGIGSAIAVMQAIRDGKVAHVKIEY